jgi:hypothetical protein
VGGTKTSILQQKARRRSWWDDELSSVAYPYFFFFTPCDVKVVEILFYFRLLDSSNGQVQVPLERLSIQFSPCIILALLQ